MPHTIHLGHSLIPKGNQPLFPCLNVNNLSLAYLNDLILQHGQRQKMIHDPVQSRHHHTAFILHQAADHLHSLPGHQVPMNICIVKQQILSRIKPDVVAETAEIIIQFLCPGVIVGNHQLPEKGLPRLLHQMNLLRVYTAADLYRPLSTIQVSIQFFILRQFY